MEDILNNTHEMSRLDSADMLGSIKLLGQQVQEVWQEAKNFKIPANYKDIKNIVVFGMGGSTLGSHIIKSVFGPSLKIPVEIVNGYKALCFVGPKTLVIASSYSGNTEEVLSAAADAKKRKAKIIAICSGGQLADWSRKNKIPALVFTIKNNPCGSPRMGLGYSIFGQIIILVKLGLVKCSSGDIKSALRIIASASDKFGANVSSENNLAKKIAIQILGKSTWFIGAEHLVGNAHVAANQFNENAKRFAGFFVLPELNHHLLEGMEFPQSNPQNICFVLLESDLYDSRVIKRFNITREVLDKNKITYVVFNPQEKKSLLQMCEALVFFSYLSFYSAMLEGIDPTAIPFVDYFKERLKG